MEKAPPSLPRGLIVDLITPVNRSGWLHLDSLARLLNHVEPYADGLFLFGPGVGGGPELKAETRAEMLAFIAARTKLPLMALITCTTKTQTVECVDLLLEAKRDSRLVLIDAPLVVRSNRGLPDWLAWLAERSNLSLALYNNPNLINRGSATKHRNLRTAVLKQTAEEVEALSGLIFRGGFKRLINYHQALRTRPGFRIYDADESRFLDQPSSAGVVSAGANLLPGAWAQVVHSVFHPDRPSRLAELLACARAVRGLGRRSKGQTLGWLMAGLKELGVIDRSLPEAPVSPEPERVSHFMDSLGLERWGLWSKGEVGV